jgi:hypothetical protein
MGTRFFYPDYEDSKWWVNDLDGYSDPRNQTGVFCCQSTVLTTMRGESREDFWIYEGGFILSAWEE